jgi:hypothetical protein
LAEEQQQQQEHAHRRAEQFREELAQRMHAIETQYTQMGQTRKPTQKEIQQAKQRQAQAAQLAKQRKQTALCVRLMCYLVAFVIVMLLSAAGAGAL